MSNPYQSPKTVPPLANLHIAHSDWKWMAVFAYAFCTLCMCGVIGKTNPHHSAVYGIGHGFIRAPFFLGDSVFALAIPLLAVLPTALVAIPFRLFYRDLEKRKTFVNLLMLLLAAVVAVFNASLYRGD